jgi:hypothetical protein
MKTILLTSKVLTFVGLALAGWGLDHCGGSSELTVDEIADTGASEEGGMMPGGDSGSDAGVSEAEAASCSYSDEILDVTFAGFDGSSADCEGDAAASYTATGAAIKVEGSISGSLATGWTIDSCVPNTGCSPQTSTLRVTSPTLDITIPSGTFVRIRIAKGKGGVPPICWTNVFLQNLPTWAGVPNPTGTDEGLWLAVDRSSVAYAQLISPFTVMMGEQEQCLSSDGHRPYNLRFSATNSTVDDLSVLLATTQVWQVSSGPLKGMYRVRNLDARFAGANAQWQDAYWLARAP